MQKYNRGNLVKVLNENNKLAVIEGSYGDLFGKKGTGGGYSVIFIDQGNSLAWVYENNMELVEEGGEHLFEVAKENKEKTMKQYTDFKFIKDNWNSENPYAFSSITIRFLFDKLGYKSSFERNGEFFILYSDWAKSFPLYDYIVTKDKFEDVEKIFNKEISQENKDKVKFLHDLFHVT